MVKKIFITQILFFISFAGKSINNKRPNIVFILADDLGWTDLECMGSDFYETPNIDNLRNAGMLFTHAYANAPNSAPSRACLLTGKYTPRHGIYTVSSSARGMVENRKLIPMPNNMVLSTEFTTFPGILRENGYRTIFIGKWHLGRDEAGNGPLSHGFDINIAGDDTGAPYTYYYPFCSKNGRCLENLNLNDSTYSYLTDRLTEEAVQQIRKSGNRPFFLYMSHYAVHTPLEGRKDIVKKYLHKSPGKNHNNPSYEAMIQSLDESVGRIVQVLKEENRLDNTLIVFFSDNGAMLDGISNNSPLRGGKGTPYEGGNRVPLIFSYGDKIEANSINEMNVIGLDLFPTFLDFAGIAIPEDLDGISLKKLILKEEDSSMERNLYFFFPAYLESYRNPENFRTTPYSSIISGDWKLIYFFEDDKFELYHLKNDIGESNDLSKKLSIKGNDLLIKLKKWEQMVNASVNFEPNLFYMPKYPN
jgi:arylsulfatase A-like enzyme